LNEVIDEKQSSSQEKSQLQGTKYRANNGDRIQGFRSPKFISHQPLFKENGEKSAKMGNALPYLRLFGKR